MDSKSHISQSKYGLYSSLFLFALPARLPHLPLCKQLPPRVFSLCLILDGANHSYQQDHLAHIDRCNYCSYHNIYPIIHSFTYNAGHGCSTFYSFVLLATFDSLLILAHMFYQKISVTWAACAFSYTNVHIQSVSQSPTYVPGGGVVQLQQSQLQKGGFCWSQIKKLLTV